MLKLYELLNCKPGRGDFGVEIECEGENINSDCPAGWKAVDDGSLRGEFPHSRCEFVFSQPASLSKSIERISNLAEAQKTATLNFSFRTSVHVHVNCQQLTWGAYCAFIYTSLLMEGILSKYCGDTRNNNRFCLRVSDAEGIVEHMLGLFANGVESIRAIRENDVRYGFINIAATQKYGSLEFRGMRGTLDVAILTNWLKCLYNIRKFAIECDSPTKVHDLFVKLSPEDFITKILGDVAPAFYYRDAIMDIRKAFSLTLELPYNFVKN
jgi:hypothetical protein